MDANCARTLVDRTGVGEAHHRVRGIDGCGRSLRRYHPHEWWKLDNYRKNPVFLWAHKSGEPPIGRTIDVHVETAPVPALIQHVEFADAATYKFADTVFHLYKGGYMRAVSVGFMPLAAPTRITGSEGNATGGYEFTSQELLELSAVSLPANP
jgi:uncharacterized protein